MTHTSTADPAAATKPHLPARVVGPDGQSASPPTVQMPVDALDWMVEELFSVGLALHAEARCHGDQQRVGTERLLDTLNGIVARIRQVALTSTRSPLPPTDMAATVAPGSHLEQPDLVAFSSLPNGELATIDLLDAAHSARRTLMTLQNITGGHMTLADVSVSEAH